MIYDILAPEGETMSEAVDRYLEGPGKSLAAASTVLVAMHLLNLLDPKYDPVHYFFVGLKVVKKRGW